MAFNAQRFYRNAASSNWDSATALLKDAFDFGFFGSFFHTADQTLAASDTAYDVSFNSTALNYGITMVDNKTFKLANRGDYLMTVVAHLHNLDQNAQDVTFWVVYNGTPYANSATISTIPARKSAGVPTETLLTMSFIGTALADGDEVVLKWSGTSTNLSMGFTAANGSIPAAPSVRATISQIGAER